ncbi:MAG: isochorismatase family protein [Bacteroidales bacterium]|nr:isochorismatase family protein [Bacteroidales bacterium]
MNTLIIVDLQEDFYSPDGSLYVRGAEILPERIAGITENYNNVIFTLDWHPLNHCSFKQNGGPWPVHCLMYSRGASLPDEVLSKLDITRQNVFYYHKGNRSYEEEYEAFKSISDELLKVLNDSEKIDICGLCGDYCVGLTLKRLAELGLKPKIRVLKELIGSIDDGTALNRYISEL